MLRKWLKAGYMDGSVLYPTNDGTPQGGIISPVLANLALDGLGPLLAERFPLSRRCQVYMSRYADDFVITGSSREVLEHEVRPLVAGFLAERGLALSPTKTRITHIDAGFDFLGQNLRKYGGKLIIKPSPRSVHSFVKEVRDVIRKNPTATAGGLVMLLNPMIRGWANYHRHVVSSRCFSGVDSAIWAALWRWSCRRHPNKSAKWIRRRYFVPHDGRQWVFAGLVTRVTGEKETVRLVAASATAIRRHVIIRAAANPYDPAWADYFRRRNRPFGDVLARPSQGRL